MFLEFKKFLMRGNVLDLAVALVIGIAFGGVVTSFVNDILMPPVGLALGRVSFSDLFVSLDGRPYPSIAAAKAAGAATLNYGLFITAIINFIVVAFAVFLVMRAVTRVMTRPAAVAAPATRDCPFCAMAIPLRAVRCPQCTSEVGARA
jgi:large conductance mechanosensitive channel